MTVSAIAAGVRGDADLISGLLRMLCRQLDMDIAYVTTIDAPASSGAGRDRTIRIAVTRDGQQLQALAGARQLVDDTWCAPVLVDGLSVVPDVAAVPELGTVADAAIYSVGSHAGVALGGTDDPIGTLCVLGHRPTPSLGAHAISLLTDAADVIAPWIMQFSTTSPAPGYQWRAPDPGSVGDGQQIESLTRPLLAALQQLTRLGSTYLTRVREDLDEQHIVFAHNTRPDFVIPEGLTVSWEDTLCKRALDDGRACTSNVSDQWGDSQAARDLGVQVYASVPITLSDGTLWGTLCATDSRPAQDVDTHLPTMQMFGALITAEIERSQRMLTVARDSAHALKAAHTDALTGCATRHLIEPWLSTALAGLDDGRCLVVSFIDVNDFKTINDTYGHAAGDAVLRDVASHLLNTSRPDDLIARYGGDEFLLAAVVATEHMTGYLDRIGGLRSVSASIDGRSDEIRLAIGTARASASDTTKIDAVGLIHEADRSMYRHKLAVKDQVAVPTA